MGREKINIFGIVMPNAERHLVYGIMIIAFLLFASSLSAQSVMSVWPAGKKPNSNGTKVSDSVTKEHIFVVADPRLYYFPAPKEKRSGTAVLLCPGGGYLRLPNMKSEYKLTSWFNDQGVDAFVLISRLPHQKDLVTPGEAPLQDAQRAMKIIRANAEKWSINPQKIGVMGTSAGGHVASMLGTRLDDVSIINDALDKYDFKPNFLALLSGVITMGRYAHGGSRDNLLGDKKNDAEMVEKYSNENQVTEKTPPTFLVHAFNDGAVPAQNSLLFYNALMEKKVSSTIHIFPQGGHGIGAGTNPGSTNLWKDLLKEWLVETGFLPKKSGE